MKWEKKGKIFVSTGKNGWDLTHAQLPIVDTQDEKYWRIYYASRNNQGQSNLSYIEVEPGRPENILYVHNEPIINLGKLGTFDESGIMPVALVNFNEKKYLYYAGWSLRKTVPYHNTIGLAISHDNGLTFKKYGEGPIFDINPFEPYSNGTINILIEDNIWKAWYQSITKWEKIGDISEPFYHLKYAESTDGICWNRKGNVAIDFIDENEAGICSASVIRSNNNMEMWYCYRGIKDYRSDKNSSYRIGYARSTNGNDWIRNDEIVGIDVSVDGWDSEMLAYPNVIEYKGEKYMFYNGNGFGRSGFGYAILTF